MLDLSSLRKALASLQAVLAKSNDGAFMAGLDDVAREAVRAGVIQHFEFSFELSWKFMRRWLKVNLSPSAADGVTRRELFRLAAENQLIEDVDAWMGFNAARNLVSHTYVPELARQVLAIAGDFTPAAARLLRQLEARND